MTETQIEHLKKGLTDSKLANNSTELDQLILKSAHESAQKNRANGEPKKRNMSLLRLVLVSFLRSATLAIVFTSGVFLAMGQLLNVDDTFTANNPSKANADKPVFIERLEPSIQAPIVRHKNLALEPAPSGLSRDQILMNFELSDTEELLAQLSFNFSQNPEFDQGNIEVAMLDINSMIQIGELDDARQRYSDFKVECGDCNLPDSLEALVLAAQLFVTKNNSSNTG